MLNFFKQPKFLLHAFSFALVFWGCLFLLQIFSVVRFGIINDIAAKSEFVIHILTLSFITKMYNLLTIRDRKIILWLVIFNYGLFINDIAFYTSVYLQKNFILSPSFEVVILGYIPYLVWILALNIFLFKLLIRYVFLTTNLLKTAPFFLLVNLLIAFLFFSSINHVFYYISWERISHMFSFLCELIIFSSALLCMIYSENKYLSVCLLGFITLISGDFFINYSFLSQTNNLLSYGELFWFLGQILIFFGITFLYKNKKYIIKDWFSKNNSIKNNLALWSFGTSISSFLLFFLVTYLFSGVNKELLLGLPLFILLYSAILVVFSIMMGRRFESPFKRLAANVEALSQNDKAIIDNNFSIQEFIFLQKFIVDAFESREQKDRSRKTLLNITAQAAHDIRSPLAAINTALLNVSSIPEKKRIIIRNAAKRINDIANNLLISSNNQTNESIVSLCNPDASSELIIVAIEAIVAEKKYEYKQTGITICLESLENTFGCFAILNLPSFKRVLSNLINNSVEAIKSNGTIYVRLKATKTELLIEIEDNGCGIPTHILPKITEQGFSFNKKNGAGYGLSYAQQYIHQIHGHLGIESEPHKGTKITITLPKSSPPSWFCSTLKVSQNCTISILDDDDSIHNAWDERFIQFSLKQKTNHHYTSDSLPEKTLLNANSIYLVDYELLSDKYDGLDIIEKYDLFNNSILVTSAFEDNTLRQRCEKMGVKIIPKPYVPYIPIEILHTSNFNTNIILIDDDEMMRCTWELAADAAGVEIATYSSFEKLEKELCQFDKNSLIFIDSHLGNNINGQDCAKQLYNLGYHNLHLTTGYPTIDIKKSYWLRSVIGKEPPF
ncbi:sensor histidine kinase [Legionella jamestowniensis]|uniref:sensor histidine kinase n=1 Tax=Legionella jamestowniensis TaxID=455 RepID=UPI0008E1273E|nr:ATP-binding protein [Legionella jamestowniensis]SFM08423.1 Signal transduction histidine kinase [Legionella jamestowniensis DSM 19215]